MEKRRKTFFTIFVITATFVIAGLAVVASSSVKKEVPVTTSLAQQVRTEAPPKYEKQEFISPDGTYNLTVTNSTSKNGLVLQTFQIKKEIDKIPVKIFEKESDADSLITVPFNTFSPDHKYIFLTLYDSGKVKHIVVRTDGEAIKEDSHFVEVESLFAEKHPEYVITDVTGWGSYALIVVNTNTAEGKIGPSWWFDLSNFSFIRLSSRFN